MQRNLDPSAGSGEGVDVIKENVTHFLFHSGSKYSGLVTRTGEEEKKKKV